MIEDLNTALNALRWDADHKVINCFNEEVWLKACLDEKGARIGITDCCHSDNPCPHHQQLDAFQKAAQQN